MPCIEIPTTRPVCVVAPSRRMIDIQRTTKQQTKLSIVRARYRVFILITRILAFHVITRPHHHDGTLKNPKVGIRHWIDCFDGLCFDVHVLVLEQDRMAADSQPLMFRYHW